jgi:hypothetical protein
VLVELTEQEASLNFNIKGPDIADTLTSKIKNVKGHLTIIDIEETLT